MIAAAGPGGAPWWQTGVVYQVYPRSFQDSNGDGVGDLQGITARLDHLVDLGVDALWIGPFYPSPMKDFGYDVTDLTGVDPLFGSLADVDRLLAEAHRRGLRVVVDFIPNHTSDQHPWFLASRSARDDLHRGFYVWRDPAPGGGPPNNWLSTFGGPAWTWDERTGQYYLHTFLREQPDLDWRNPGVRRAMLDALAFWLERGVDGFRVDCAHAVMKDPALRDNPPAPAGALREHKDHGAWSTQLHLHDRGHPDVHGVYREVRALLDRHGPPRTDRPRVAIGELHLFDPRELAAYYGARLDELHLPMNFALLKAPWTAAAVRGAVDAAEAALPPGAWPCWAIGNHDEPRVASRLGAAGARAAMLLLLTLRGTPTLYYGDELGMEDVPVPPHLAQDPWGRNVPGLGLGRDPERSPMPWDGGPNAGFARPGVRPWLPLGADATVRNVAAERARPDGMLALTRRLLSLRRERPALHLGSYQPVDLAEPAALAFVRAWQGDRVTIFVSFSPRPARVDRARRGGPVLASTAPGVCPGDPFSGVLGPYEGVILDG